MASDSTYGLFSNGPKFGAPSVDYIICSKFTVESNSCNTFFCPQLPSKGTEVWVTRAEVAGDAAVVVQSRDDKQWRTLTDNIYCLFA